MVVSFIGSSCTNFCPVRTAQSTISFRSIKSPTPKSSSERRENTGIATPAPRHGVPPVLKCSPSTTTASCCRLSDLWIYKVRLRPYSHAETSPESFFNDRNLYSAGNVREVTSIFTSHTGYPAPLMRTACLGSHCPIAGRLPDMASTSSGFTIGADTRIVTCPLAGMVLPSR